MDEQARTKRIALELEKLKRELARQDRDLADMQRDHDVTDEDLAACIAKIEPAPKADHTGTASFANKFVVRG